MKWLRLIWLVLLLFLLGGGFAPAPTYASPAIPVVEGYQATDGAAVASTDLVLDKPAGVQVGELLLLIVNNEDDTSTPQFTDNLEGWTFIGTSGTSSYDAHIGAFWRIATGGEGETVTVVAESADFWIGWYIRISGIDSGAPINASAFNVGMGHSGIPGVTTDVDDCLAIYAESFDGGDGAPFSVSGEGWSETDEQATGGAAYISACWGTKEMPSLGATGTATVQPSVTDGAAFFQVAIAGETAPPPGTSAQITVTAIGYVVSAPSGLILTYISDHEVGISWTKGDGANNTMVRAAYGRTPESRTDGYLIYYGTGNSTSDTAVSLDETATPIYYRAWSQNSAGSWEPTGVSDLLEGFGMTTIAIALIVLVFTILAFWRRDAVLYMLGVIGWIFMTFYLVNRDYPAENEYLPFAIATFCLAVTLVMAIQAIRIYFYDRPTPPTSSEIQAEHKKKVYNLTRRQTRRWWEE